MGVSVLIWGIGREGLSVAGMDVGAGVAEGFGTLDLNGGVEDVGGRGFEDEDLG